MKTKLLILFLALTTIGYSQFWTEKSTAFTTASRGLSQITIADSNTAWARAYDGSGGGDTSAEREFTKTTDGGQTWTTGLVDLGIANSGLSFSDFFALDANTAWAVMYGTTIFNRGGIFKTSDGGTTWTKQSTAQYTNGASFPNVVYFWDANNGFCQGDPVGGYYELYTTTNGGVNWTRVPSVGIPSPLSGEYGYVGQIEVLNNRMWWTTNKGRIFISDDQGLTFTAHQSPIPDFGGAAPDAPRNPGLGSGNISFFNENEGLLINQAGAVWKTNDGGQNWISVTTNGNIFPNSFACIEGSTAVISCNITSNNSGSSYSLDSGVTWIDIDTLQHGGVKAKDGLILSGGFNTDATTGGIYKYTGMQLPLTTNDNIITTFNAYPNPVKNIFTVEGIDTITNISIFNLLGQNIMEVVPNKNKTELDMSPLNNGTYFVKVTINGTIETMKIIK